MTKQYCHNKKRKFLVKRGRRKPYKIFILSNINVLTLSNMYAIFPCFAQFDIFRNDTC